jgi:tetratricopeptide (TPR) repeat protein
MSFAGPQLFGGSYGSIAASLVALYLPARSAIIRGVHQVYLLTNMRSCSQAFVLALLAHLVFSGQQAASAVATSHIGKGYELVQSNRYAEAAAEFRAALELDPNAFKARYQLAVCLFALGEWEQSRKEFDQLATATKGNPGVIYYLARLDLLAGDFEAAIRRLESMIANPPFPDAALYLGSAYLAKGDVTVATKWLRKGAETDPRDFRVHYRLARVLQQAGQHEESEREYALSTELREGYNQGARQSTACSQALRFRPPAEAYAICQQIFDPSDPDRLTTLGMLYGENGRYEAAIEPLERAAQLDPDSFEIYHNLGLTYFRLKRFAEARATLEKAVGLRPNFFGSNALLGATLYALKDDAAAFQVLEFAHRLKPEDGDTAELLFRECLILGNKKVTDTDYATGLRFLESAASLRPGNAGLERQIAAVKNMLAAASPR